MRRDSIVSSSEIFHSAKEPNLQLLWGEEDVVYGSRDGLLPPKGTICSTRLLSSPYKTKTSRDPKPSEGTPSQESDGSQGLLWVMGAVLGVSALLNKTRKELPGSSPSQLKDECVMDLTQGEEMPIHEALKSSC